VKRRMKLAVVMLLGGCIVATGQGTGYEINGIQIPKDTIRIEHKCATVSEQSVTVPALQEDVLTLGTGIADMRVAYKRYRNAAPGFPGEHPSLTSSSMGVGIGVSPDPWHWHYADSTRIFVNGKSVFADREAVKMDWREGLDYGRVHFTWDAPEANITLNIAVPGNRMVAYVEYLIEPKGEIDSIDIRLRCFPAAYAGGPDGRPSHRWVSTPGQSVEVRRGEPGQKLPFTDQDGWVFFADKHHDYQYGRGFGPVGLVLAEGDGAITGEVIVTGYGVDAVLHCAPECRRVRFAMHAFTFYPNSHALETLKKRSEADQEILQTLSFWQ